MRLATSPAAAEDALRRAWLDRYGVDFTAPDAAERAPSLARARDDDRAGPAITEIVQADALVGPLPPLGVRVMARAAFGHTAAELADFNAGGSTDAARLAAWVDRQLNWSAIADGTVDARFTIGGFSTLGKTASQLWTEHRNAADGTTRGLPQRESERAKVIRALYSRRQLRERLVDFWHDHFNVNIADSDVGPMFPAYDRDVIRAEATGNFRAMLEGVARSAAMMYYLDNVSNTRAGPNENFARELLELHTFGAQNYLGFLNPFQVPPAPEDPSYPIGYTDVDVYETAAAFTGWSIANGRNGTANTGDFAYVSNLHDQGPKFVLGLFILPERPALRDGQDILDRLASHPRVAQHVCRKLVRRFVGDQPNEPLVQACASLFRQHWQAPDQISRVMRFLLTSQPFMDTWAQKSRRPFEAVVAALRGANTSWGPVVAGSTARTDDFHNRLNATGNGAHRWAPPNGYPDASAAWRTTAPLASTWKMLDWLTETSDDTLRLLPIIETSRATLGVANWTARKLVEFWCERLLGHQPAQAQRDRLVAFLAQNGNPDTYVIADDERSVSSDPKAHYNHSRIRGMVSLILLSPEFLTR